MGRIYKKNQPVGILKGKTITRSYQNGRYPIASICKTIKNVVDIKQYGKKRSGGVY